ncbi:MAG: hypothetical protein ACYCV7_12585 [Acidimicrobiales bacterium]
MNQSRKPKGQPTGGQFAAKSNPESVIELASPQAAGRPLSDVMAEMDRLRAEAHTVAVSEMSDLVLERYPDATHVRLDTVYISSNAYATAGAVQLADGTQIESDDMYPETWDTIEAYATAIWPDCEQATEESMLVPLTRPGPARTTQPARPDGTAAAIDPNQQLYGFLGDVRARLAAGERPMQVSGPFGVHGMGYGEEDGEAYAVIGFALPDGVYAETDGGTYGELQGFRIFIDAE